MSTDTPQRPQEPQEAAPRWVDVLFPPYRIQEPSSPLQRVPRWVERMQAGQLKAKDLTR